MPIDITTPKLQRFNSYFHEEISPEPELGVQRHSTIKALPTYNPPELPTRPMRKYRVSALLVFALSVVSFVLTLLVVLAGKKPSSFADEYMLKFNASHVGKDIIRFERASSTAAATQTASAAPSATTSSSSNPLDFLNPFSPSNPLSPGNPDNPLNQLPDSLEPVLGNLTDSINDGLGDVVNEVIEGLVDSAGLSDFYYIYTSTFCEGSTEDGASTNKDGVKIAKCTRYDNVEGGLNTILPQIPSSIVIAGTNISVPIIAQLTDTAGTLSSTVANLFRALTAFLILSMIGSGVGMLLAIPSALLPDSRFFIYTNLFFTQLGAVSAFVAAIILTALIKSFTGLAGGLGDAVSLFIGEGRSVLVFAWVSWACLLVVSVSWTAVWFVEVRGWSFRKRQRSKEEVGNWRGIKVEVWRDLKGEKSL